jgi:hypothetical protein
MAENFGRGVPRLLADLQTVKAAHAFFDRVIAPIRKTQRTVPRNAGR